MGGIFRFIIGTVVVFVGIVFTDRVLLLPADDATARRRQNRGLFFGRLRNKRRPIMDLLVLCVVTLIRAVRTKCI